MFRKWIAAGLGVIGSVVVAAIALSQAITVPQIALSHPFTDLVQIIPNGAPVAGNVYTPWAAVTNVYGYYKSGTGAQNQTITLGQNVTFTTFANAGAINTVYIYTPTAPFDGARSCFYSIGGITNILMYASTGQTLNNAVTTLAANAQDCYLYSASNTTWDRSH